MHSKLHNYTSEIIIYLVLSTEKNNIENRRKNIENPMCCLIFKTNNSAASAYQYNFVNYKKGALAGDKVY